MALIAGPLRLILVLLLLLVVAPAQAENQADSPASLPGDPFAAVPAEAGGSLPGDPFASDGKTPACEPKLKGDPFGSGPQSDPFAEQNLFSQDPQALDPAGQRAIELTAGPVTMGLYGYLETRNRFRLENGEPLSLRQRVWLETEGRVSLGEAEGEETPLYFFASAAVDFDPAAERLSEQSELVRPYIEEAFVTHDSEVLELGLGRKMLRWGTGDGINPLDLINPVDHRDPVANGRSDSREPVFLGQAIARLPALGPLQEASLEGVVVPLAQVYEINDPSSPWETYSIKQLRKAQSQGSLVLGSQELPDEVFDQAEFGLRLAGTLSGWDLALIGFYGFVDYPVYERDLALNRQGQEVYRLTPVHPSFTAVGLNFAKGLERSTLRGELALKPDMPMMLAAPDAMPAYERRPLLEGVLGFDRTYGLNFYVNFQYFYNWISDSAGLAQDAFTHGITYDVHDLFWDDALEAGVRGIVSFSSQGWTGELYGDYTPCDDWLFKVSLLIFGGPEDGQYGQYDQNSSLTLTLRYSF